MFRFLYIGKRSCSSWFKTSLIEKYALSHDTYVFSFKLPDEKTSLSIPVGKYISIRPLSSDPLLPKIRYYTPLVPKKEDGTIKLAIKIYKNGLFTQYMDHLKLGDNIEMKGPKGRFKEDLLYNKDNNIPKPLYMIAGGSGITPLLQIIRYMFLRNTLTKRKCILLFGNKTPEDIIFKDELDYYHKSFNEFNVHYYIEHLNNDSNINNNNNISIGRINKQALEQYIPIQQEENNQLMILCGTREMNTAIKKMAIDINFNEKDIFIF